MDPRTDRQDITDQREAALSAEPIETNDPTDMTDANDPTDPMERIDPTHPMERIEPFEPMDSTEFVDRTDHSEVWLVRSESRMRPFWPTSRLSVERPAGRPSR
jgi:hypothetical protein